MLTKKNVFTSVLIINFLLATKIIAKADAQVFAHESDPENIYRVLINPTEENINKMINSYNLGKSKSDFENLIPVGRCNKPGWFTEIILYTYISYKGMPLYGSASCGYKSQEDADKSAFKACLKKIKCKFYLYYEYERKYSDDPIYNGEIRVFSAYDSGKSDKLTMRMSCFHSGYSSDKPRCDSYSDDKSLANDPYDKRVTFESRDAFLKRYID